MDARDAVASGSSSATYTVPQAPFWTAFLFLLVAPSAAVIWHSVSAASVLLGAGLAALLAVRLPDLVRLKGFGLEAELQQRIEEADFTLSQLRRLAKAVAEPTLSLAAMHGDFTAQLTLRHVYDLRQAINAALVSVGVPEIEIREANGVYEDVLNAHLADRILVGVRDRITNEDARRVLECFRHPGAHTPDQIDEFLQAHGCKDASAAEDLEDFRYFGMYGQLRSPGILPGSNN